MSHALILSWATFIYLLASVFYFLRLIRGREFWGTAGTAAAVFGLAAQTIALGWRWAESYRLGIGHAPLSNLFESLVFFAWAIIALHLVVERRTKNTGFGAFVVPLAFFSMAYASFSPMESRIQPLIPALQSNWLVSHVITCFLGYAAFAIAFSLGIIYLVKDRNPSERGLMRIFPEALVLDELTYHSVTLGFIFLTIGIMTGSVWAQYAWGSYWSWDPKETWSLITWLVYAALLHARLIRGWRGKRTAVMALIGFGAVLFTYFGVNLLPGLHSYLK